MGTTTFGIVTLSRMMLSKMTLGNQHSNEKTRHTINDNHYPVSSLIMGVLLRIVMLIVVMVGVVARPEMLSVKYGMINLQN
jgi:hypothetical protein